MLLTDDQDLDKLVTQKFLQCRVDFYESCVDQLKKEIPKYVGKLSELDKCHREFGKSLRSVGSSEPNQKLQNAIFLYASKQDSLHDAIQGYSNCNKKSLTSLEEARKLIITPIREVIADQQMSRGKLLNAKKKQSKSQQPVDMHQYPDIGEGEATFTVATLPVHVKMFEKHRLKNTASVLTSLVETELRYHCQAVEDLSAVLMLLKSLGDGDDQEDDEGDGGIIS